MILTIGNIYIILWGDIFDDTTGELTENVKIELSRDNKVSWETIIDSVTNNGLYSWIITGPATTQATFRISNSTDIEIYADSDIFDIVSASIPKITTYNSPSKYKIYKRQQKLNRSYILRPEEQKIKNDLIRYFSRTK